MKDARCLAGEPDVRGAPEAQGNQGADPVADSIRRVILHEMPAADRLLLLLWYAERMTVDEIASCLHSTPVQIEAAHARALEWLRRAVRPNRAALS